MSKDASQKYNPILVTGMHRSGTSMLAQTLFKLGVNLGEEEQISSFRPEENPDGFWEDPRIFGLNDEILHQLDSRWDSLSSEFFQFDWQIQIDQLEPQQQQARKILSAISSDSQFWG